MSPELEMFIEQEVSSGRFPNRDAFIAHAVRLVQIESEDAIEGIQAGLDDVAAGRMKPIDEAFAAIRQAIDPSGRQ